MKRAATQGISVFAFLMTFMAVGAAFTTPCVASPVAAQSKVAEPAPDSEVAPYSPGSNNIALDLGQVFLMGNLGDQYSGPFGGQLHYTYGVSDLFGFDGELGLLEPFG